MFLNFDYILLLLKKGITAYDTVRLQAIKQNKKGRSEAVLETIMDDSIIKYYEENGYIWYVKGKKTDSELKKMRLTKKGLKLLEDIETPDKEEQDVMLMKWLVEKYEKHGKMIGNKKRIVSGIAHFRSHTGIEKNHLSFLIAAFVGDSHNMKYNNKLEKAFFSSENSYSRKFNIDECRLWAYYKKRLDYFEKQFKLIDLKMKLKEALEILGIKEYDEKIFKSSSKGELAHLNDYFILAKEIGKTSWFRPWFEERVKEAEENWERPKSVFQHIRKMFIEDLDINLKNIK